MSFKGFIISIFRAIFCFLIPAPTPGTYKLIVDGGEKSPFREDRSSSIEVTAVKDGWVRYEILPLNSFAPRSMEIAAFNLSYKRIDRP